MHSQNNPQGATKVKPEESRGSSDSRSDASLDILPKEEDPRVIQHTQLRPSERSEAGSHSAGDWNCARPCKPKEDDEEDLYDDRRVPMAGKASSVVDELVALWTLLPVS